MMPDGTDRVEIDELEPVPDDPEIESIENDGTPVVSGRTKHEWMRETYIVGLTGACPYCDREITEQRMRSPTGEYIVRRMCEPCDEQWIENRTHGFSGVV